MSLKIIVKHKVSCFIRMSMNNLKDIHNSHSLDTRRIALFYQDVNEQFEGYTQPITLSIFMPFTCFIRMSMNNLKDIHNVLGEVAVDDHLVLSGCQWTIWRIYTTHSSQAGFAWFLFYQDVNEQFEGYTQPARHFYTKNTTCFIRMSMNNLKDIHNVLCYWVAYIQLFYQDFNEQFCCKSTKNPWNLQIYWKIFWYFRKK